jgi:hypothetical protein
MNASRRPETTIDGSLYELVARGQKDLFFFKDEAKSVNPFDYRYDFHPSVLPEVRRTVPLNAPKWGGTVEFDLDFPGDLLDEINLLIDLSSWLSPEIDNSKSIITDLSGNTYGYTNGIGYFLCKKIELYHDNMLIQEVSGDALYALSRTRNSYNNLFVDDTSAGIHDGTPRSIQLNATPGQLSIALPFPGCQLGDNGLLPICAMREQKFRLKIFLRKLEEVVESSGGQPNPAPWNMPLKIQKSRNAPFIQFKPIDRIHIAQPVLSVETRQFYVSNKCRQTLMNMNHTIPFRRYFENIFNFNDFDYSPLDRNAIATSVRLLDGQFNAERIVYFFRNSIFTHNNQLINFEGGISGSDFYNTLDFIIAGKDREGPWAPWVFKDLMQHAKEERATSKNVSIMNWSYGWRQEDTIPATKQPEGGINFTTADKPNININLQNVIPGNSGRNVELRSIIESWGIFEIVDGRGRFKYGN